MPSARVRSSRSRQDDALGDAWIIHALRRARSGTGVLGAVCLVVAAYALSQQRDAHSLEVANSAGLRADYVTAIVAAAQVRGPRAAGALLLEATAYGYLGRLRSASRVYALAVRRNPEDWIAHRDWASTLFDLGDHRRAREELRQALHLNPLMSPPPGLAR